MVFGAERPRLARQNDEHRLRDFLGQIRIADLPQRHGINQIDVARHERGERLLGIARAYSRSKVRSSFMVSFIHLRRREKVTDYFWPFEVP